MKFRHTILITLLLALSCSDRHTASSDTGTGMAARPHHAAVPDLPLPPIPDSLTRPAGRASYLAAHFWDSLDFADRTLSLDTAFMEQNFANYLTVFPVIESDTDRDTAIRALLHKAAADPEASRLLHATIEKYLADPDSPMRDEDLFIAFCRQMLDTPGLLDKSESARTEYNLETALMNRPGSMAPDFRILRPDGTETTLRSCRGDTLLLVFHDPGCATCRQTMDRLTQLPLPDGWSVLAVDTESAPSHWRPDSLHTSSHWQQALALTDVDEADLYRLPVLPTLYLIDTDGRIILKDPDLNTLARIITE